MGRTASAAVALDRKRRIARQGRSRFSVVEFCRRDVSPKSFYGWRRRLQVDPSRRAKSRTPRAASRLFVPVELPRSTPVGIRIELPGVLTAAQTATLTVEYASGTFVS